jgi:hypothetical protein
VGERSWGLRERLVRVGRPDGGRWDGIESSARKGMAA